MKVIYRYKACQQLTPDFGKQTLNPLKLSYSCILKVLRNAVTIESYCVHEEIFIINILSQVAPRVFINYEEYYWWKNEFQRMMKSRFRELFTIIDRSLVATSSMTHWSPDAGNLRRLELIPSSESRLEDAYHLDTSHLDMTSENNAYICLYNTLYVIIRMRV